MYSPEAVGWSFSVSPFHQEVIVYDKDGDVMFTIQVEEVEGSLGKLLSELTNKEIEEYLATEYFSMQQSHEYFLVEEE